MLEPKSIIHSISPSQFSILHFLCYYHIFHLFTFVLFFYLRHLSGHFFALYFVILNGFTHTHSPNANIHLVLHFQSCIKLIFMQSCKINFCMVFKQQPILLEVSNLTFILFNVLKSCHPSLLQSFHDFMNSFCCLFLLVQNCKWRQNEQEG